MQPEKSIFSAILLFYMHLVMQNQWLSVTFSGVFVIMGHKGLQIQVKMTQKMKFCENISVWSHLGHTKLEHLKIKLR